MLRPDDGETITNRERRVLKLLVERPQVSITWSRYGPGERGTDLHVHREHTDAFYVLEGELTLMVGPGAEEVRLAAGGFVAVPPNVAHGFDNDSDADAEWLNVHAPDQGFAAYLRALRDGTEPAFDSFDPPADGGRPASEAIVSGPDEGERIASGPLLKGVMPELCVVEWPIDPPTEHGDRVDSYYRLPTGVLGIHTPDAGLADSLRGRSA